MEFIILYSRGSGRSKTCAEKTKNLFCFNSRTKINALYRDCSSSWATSPYLDLKHQHGFLPLLDRPLALSSANQLHWSYWIYLHRISQCVPSSPLLLTWVRPSSPLTWPFATAKGNVVSQSVVFRPAAAASPRNLLEVHILRHLPRPPESDSLGVEPRELWCNRCSRWFGHMLMTEKRCSNPFSLSPVPLPEHSYFTCRCPKISKA